MAITLQQRKRKLAATSLAGLGMMALIVILINVLGHWAFVRLDLTQNNSYSLSSASKKLVQGLAEPVIVKAYFTPDLPPPYNAYERYVRDLLAEYHSASRGKVRFEFVLQNPPAEFERKANEAALLPIQFEQMGSDQLQIRRGYMGLVLYHHDKSETLPIIKDVQQLEYDITSRIAKMAARQKKTIAVTSGHGEISFHNDPMMGRLGGQSPPAKLAEDLKDLYDFSVVSLMPGAAVPIAADALLVVGPKQKFDEKSLWAIDQAIMRGVPTAFLIDIKNLMVGQFYVTPLDSGLGDLLKHYGAQVGDRLVYDAQCETIGVTQNVSGFAFTTSMRYPYILQVDRIMTSHPIGRGLDAVGIPFTTTIEAVQGLAAGVHFTTLLYSSPKSWLAPAAAGASVAPNNVPQPAPGEPHGPYSIAGILEGNFTSYFSGKPVPVPGQNLIGTSPKTQILVIGTSRFLDPALPQFPGTDAFSSNILAYLSKDETLLGVRSKGDIIRPLKPVSGAVREIIKYLSILGVPVFAAFLGLWRWRLRQNWRLLVTATFAPKTIS